MEHEKKITYIHPDVDSDEDVEWELVLSGPVNYKKPDFVKRWEEKMDKYYEEIDEEKFVDDLKRAGFEVEEV